jgi:hypothetical protein
LRIGDLWTTAGEYQGHKVALWAGPFGHETLSVDGREVSRKWSLRLRTTHPIAVEGFPVDTATVECGLTGPRLVLRREGEAVASFGKRPWLVVGAEAALVLGAGVLVVGVAMVRTGRSSELSREVAVARTRLHQLQVIGAVVDRYQSRKLGFTRRLEVIRELAADEQPVGPWLAVLLDARKDGVRAELVRPRAGEVEARGDARSRAALDSLAQRLERSPGTTGVSVDALASSEPDSALAFTLNFDVARTDPAGRVSAVLKGAR